MKAVYRSGEEVRAMGLAAATSEQKAAKSSMIGMVILGMGECI
jgi:hypothetical protein